MTTPENTEAKDPKASGDKTVVLAVDGLSSDEHTYAKNADPITREGTEVPSSKSKSIIEQAAAQGVRVFEKES